MRRLDLRQIQLHLQKIDWQNQHYTKDSQINSLSSHFVARMDKSLITSIIVFRRFHLMNEMRKEIEELIKGIDDEEALTIVRDAAKELSDLCSKRKAITERRKQAQSEQK